MHPTAKSTFIKAAVCFSIIILAFAIIVPIMSVNFLASSANKRLDARSSPLYQDASVVDKILVDMEVTLVKDNEVKVTMNFEPFGKYRGDSTLDKLALPVDFAFNSNLVKTPVGSVMAKRTETLQLGATDNYPFDQPESFFQLSASQIAGNDTVAVPFGLIIFGNFAGFNIETSIAPDEVGEDAYIVGGSVLAQRSNQTITFSVLLTVLMWVIALSIVALTLSFLFIPGSGADLPPLPAFVGLLFALPSVRNTQPNSPPIGALMDVVGFFWSMALVGVCTITLILTMTSRKWVAYEKKLAESS